METQNLNGSLGEIPANMLFKVEIKVALNWDREASTITDFGITFQPPSNSPTTDSPTTLEPQIAPTTAPILTLLSEDSNEANTASNLVTAVSGQSTVFVSA